MDAETAAKVRLEAKSPYEMRVHLGDHVPDMDVKSALKTGDLGFLHSLHHRIDGRWAGHPARRLDHGLHVPLPILPQPGHLDAQERNPGPLERAIEEVRKYANGLKAMNGGFTLSGGEPLMQDRFAVRLFAAVKAMGVHTAIETNGYYGHNLTDDELRTIDLVILDMKAFTREQHERVTGGMHNEDVLEFCNRLAELKRPMWLRYVLVPGLTDIPEEMEAVASFGASLGVVERVEILPFHQLGQYKWERLGLEYTLAATDPPTNEGVAKAVAIFRDAGLRAD